MKHIGIIGWRGMVGSVLLTECARRRISTWSTPTFFSTLAGRCHRSPDIGAAAAQDATVQDARDIAALAKLPILISAQGGDYTTAVHSRLRAAGWRGYRIDAASTLRMKSDAVIVLDPVNLPVMQAALRARHQGFHRRELHRVADADGRGRLDAGGRG